MRYCDLGALKAVKSPYLDILPFRKVKGKDRWKATQRFLLWFAFEKGCMCLAIEKGFSFDGASIPNVFNALDFCGKIPERYYTGKGSALKNSAGLVHDCLYAVKGCVRGLDEPLTANECDDLLGQIWRLCCGASVVFVEGAKVALKLAHTSRHWGNEIPENLDKFKITMV